MTVDEGESFDSVVSFWNYYLEITRGTNQVAFIRFKDTSGWTYDKGTDTEWHRALVSSQNIVGNGKYDVGGTILLVDDVSLTYGVVYGGTNNISDLAVTWYNLPFFG